MALLGGLVAQKAAAGEAPGRSFRHLGRAQGLASAAAWVLAQDGRGFLWIGTKGGLYRYDGTELRRWAAADLPGPVEEVSRHGDDGLVVLAEDGRLLEVAGDRLVAVRGPDGRPVRNARAATSGSDESLWVLLGHRLWLRDGAARWHRIALPVSTRHRTVQLLRRPREGVLLLGHDAVWSLSRQGPPRVLARVELPTDAVELAGGDLAVISHAGGRVLRFHGGEGETLYARDARELGLVARGETLWVAYDRWLVALPPGAAPQVLGPEHGIVGGGGLLLDQEGSLWLGTFEGLQQFPEPETLIWREAEGLPSAHLRAILPDGDDRVWVATWQGMGWIRREVTGWRGGTVAGAYPQGMACQDPAGRIWSVDHQGPFTVEADTPQRHGSDRLVRLGACVQGREGRLWSGTPAGLALLRAGGTTWDLVPGPPSPVTRESKLVLDSRGRLWMSTDEAICSAPEAQVARGGSTAWRCAPLPRHEWVNGLAEVAPGVLWAAVDPSGLWHIEDDRSERVAVERTFPTTELKGLAHSPRGGFWLVGHGFVSRVVPDPQARGFRVVERLTPWHGLPGESAEHVVEEADGDLWLATLTGAVYVPAHVRNQRLAPPRVALVEARSDARDLPLDRAISLPPSQNRIELRFAALSFRDPGLLRFQLRTGSAARWHDASAAPASRFVDLRPGDYEIQARASLDGRAWSAEPAGLRFRVAPHWWQRAWVRACLLAVLVAIAVAAYRLRVAYLLRLERQRTRLAMDLHDELGSGLGSIRILADVAGDAHAGEPSRAEAVREIGAAARVLGEALADIVWALDPRFSHLDQLAARLLQRGHGLFAGGPGRFAARLPEPWPQVELAPTVRRNVLLIGLEALHNAARHADARHVDLILEPSDSHWRLQVRDDGAGLPEDAGASGGHGLRSMRRRAAEIGGELRIQNRPGGGVDVTLTFAPGGVRRRPVA